MEWTGPQGPVGLVACGSAYSMIASTSSSFMIRYSWSSTFTSEPEYLPKRMRSWAFTSSRLTRMRSCNGRIFMGHSPPDGKGWNVVADPDQRGALSPQRCRELGVPRGIESCASPVLILTRWDRVSSVPIYNYALLI